MSKQGEETIGKHISRIAKAISSYSSTDEAKTSGRRQVNKNLKNNSVSLGSWTKEEGVITPSSLPQDFDALSTEEQRRIIYKHEKEARKITKLDNVVSFPRLVSEQRTEPIQPDLWSESSDLSQSRTFKKATELRFNGMLLNELSLGIEGDLLTHKVIKGLQLYAYEISEMYGKYGKSLTGSNTFLPTAGSLETDVLGIPKGTKAPAILSTPFLFTKAVLGGRKPNKRDIGKVYDKLWELKSKPYLLYNTRTKSRALMSILKDVLVDDKGMLHIELQPIFSLVPELNYVRERADIIMYLNRHVRSCMTMLLYEILTTALSRGFAGEAKPYKRYKDDILKRIAKDKKYKEHPKRVKEDFEESVETLKKLRLLSKFEYNENGTVCIFTINKNFLKEELNLDEKKVGVLSEIEQKR